MRFEMDPVKPPAPKIASAQVGDWTLSPCDGFHIVPDSLSPGDLVTLDGMYKRRTFWQWVCRQPRVLRQYQIGQPAQAKKLAD